MAPRIHVFAPDSCWEVYDHTVFGPDSEGVSDKLIASFYETFVYDPTQHEIDPWVHTRWQGAQLIAWPSDSGTELPCPKGSWNPTIEGFKKLSTSLSENFEARKALRDAISKGSDSELKRWSVVKPTTTTESCPVRYTCLGARPKVFMVDLGPKAVKAPCTVNDNIEIVSIRPALFWTPGSSDDLGQMTRGAVALTAFKAGHESDYEAIIRDLNDKLSREKYFTELNAAPGQELALPDAEKLSEIFTQRATKDQDAST